ncbi:LTA synthase family protein [Mesorhizobium sp. NBSH29]|uniref:LTA synthase family protein n=1 Tax=Mesorhizobium sp. NBSH29 TaxID=2654249 RepID=UPI002156074C|nr:LTA synthase family protein [Mesorhizobium sp. NBSH29]
MPLPLRIALSITVSLLLSATLVFAVEIIARGSITSAFTFLREPLRPGWTTIAFFALALTCLDAFFGRAHLALIITAPLVLAVAFISKQKAYYLGDPLYPTDFLYSRQIVELLPLLTRERPWTAVAIAGGFLITAALLATALLYWRKSARALSWKDRSLRLAVAIPLLVSFASIMDYSTFSWARDRLQIVPMMWDQKENYAFNGFTFAFALNLPMANVAAPAGYTPEAIDAAARPFAAATAPKEKPDIIIVMSESFWDPSRLPGVTITPDPISHVRKASTGHVFSPEFGGMTANVEFEALTGFSNAFLPYGSIPYQQYVRDRIPSLATFLGSQGYTTRAIHPFAKWFWNRGSVYDAFGFQKFLSEEDMPALEKRGPLASDASLTEEIIRQAEAETEPFFAFAVTLQGHGPYEPNRYPDATHEVTTGASPWTRESIRSFAEGASDADAGLQRLIDWAATRKRETIIVFFGDHLPPLGPVYVDTGFMKQPVAPRTGTLAEMKKHRETPLVIWSSRTGAVTNLETISPAFIPMHVLKTAGFTHPYYTGFLSRVQDSYAIVDRHMLVTPDDSMIEDWQKRGAHYPLINDFRLLQYDIMFGTRRAAPVLFPELGRAAGA